MIIKDVSTCVVGVTGRTNWVLVLVEDDEGRVGVGEATLDGCEELVELRVEQLGKTLRGREIRSPGSVVADVGIEDTPLGLINAAAVSAIEQALWDLEGKRSDLPVYSLLGGAVQKEVPFYANINRALLDDRTPDGFAAVAMSAVEAGFRRVKCAPFDGVYRADLSDPGSNALIDRGIDRIDQVRAAIGPKVGLMVDCHYRFTSESAPSVIDRIAEFDPFWVEAPVAEHRLEEWTKIRKACNVRLAGGEMMTGVERFRRFLDATGVDVIMPDIKYVGGISGLRAIAREADERGVLVAPHNPSGPVATMASAHVASTLTNLLVVEYAFGECDWRSELVSGAEVVARSILSLQDRPGFGFELDKRTLNDHPRREVRGLDLRLYG